ncbi:hypothetical protein Q9L58_003867 [Maublancomyces gigas]|uniref:Uncharacterized protein n=1 Tax=Discina gigas TaxID=1032678 RepID=A0ABR3GMR9_9PEZI
MSAPNTPLSNLAVNSATPAGSLEASPNVQPMHQGNSVSSLEMQRQLLQQKLAEKGNNTFTSPTDQMMTPCSKKLQNVKLKGFGKQPPKLLAKAFARSNTGPSGGLFGGMGKENKSSSLSSSNPFGATEPASQ